MARLAAAEDEVVRLRHRLESASEKLLRARRDARDAHGESGRAQRSLQVRVPW